MNAELRNKTTALAKRARDSRNVLVFAKKRQMQQNLQGLCVGCHHDEFTDTAIQSFCCLVRAFLELLVIASLPVALRSARATKKQQLILEAKKSDEMDVWPQTCCTISRMETVSSGVARGKALGLTASDI